MSATAPKFTQAHRDAAKALAVAYEAYFSAKRDDDVSAMRVWARALIDAQNVTGVVLLDEDGLAARLAGEVA
jgi:hypothetical protein